MCPDVLEGKIYAVKLIRRPVPRRSRRCLAYVWPLGLPVKTERSQAAGPFQSSWSITSQRMAATLKSSSRNLNASWTWEYDGATAIFIHFSEDLWTLTLEIAWYTDIHRYTQITQCYTVQYSAIKCCLHLLPTFPISKGANFWLWAAEGDHCGSWEGNWEQVVGSSCSIRRIKPCFFDSPPDADNYIVSKF